ncbi:hypothetical protein [Archaeoglobus sulfaticallidus]|uniref:hypothetical protein n=1 Tax=Archaeoglobus sulfaticallidus TaxID=1316941 RepID=UPI00064F83CC|nr:hypothetical protein [Archaeoglobus sulfaticallidus]
MRKRYVRHDDSVLIHFPDKHGHAELVEDLETRYRVEEVTFRTIYGEKEGFRVYAPKRVAKKIEIQAPEAEIYNADLRREVEYLAARGLSRLSEPFQDRFDLSIPELKVFECKVRFDNPVNPSQLTAIESRQFSVEGREKVIIGGVHELR